MSELNPELAADEKAVAAWAEQASPLDVLIRGEAGGDAVAHDDFLACTWATVRAVATEAFIPARQGRIVLLASRPAEVPHAGPTRAALENLARTLSVEWARFGIITTAIAPGPTTTDEEIAQLVPFLCSPAGAYFSGCRFDLGLAERGDRSR